MNSSVLIGGAGAGRCALVAFLLAASVPAVASARPRASVPTFTVARGAEGLAHFGPAVTRAVVQALADAGVEVGAGGESAVQGRVEELGGDRVRLSASVRGKTISVEGPLDAIDAVAAQLAGRLAPLLGGEAHAAAPPAHKAAPVLASAVARPVPVSAPPAVPKPAAPAEKPAEKPAAPAPAAAPPPPASTAPAPTPVTGTSTPTTTSTAAPAPAAESAPASPPPATIKPAAKDDDDEAVRPQTPRVTVPVYPPPVGYGYVRGRVVAHAVADIPNAFSGAGQSATQALYYFLRGRLKLSVIPTGYGLAPPNIAADEGWRSGARAVVMARLQSIEYRPNPAGQSVVTRLEVIVIRDGRLALRRIVESAPTDPGPVGLRRNRALEDPIFSAITQSLESIVSDLNLSIAPVR